MLMDILATFVGFIAIILLLSLIVTGLTQLSTATLRLRVRNLRRALTVLINDLRGGGLTKKGVRSAVEDTITAANFGTLQAPNDMIAGLGLVRVSWIASEDLIDCLKTAGVNVTPADAQKTLTAFRRLEVYMEKRFTLFTRFITFGVALFVAVWFQISSPELLRSLWSDAELRSRYEAVADELLKESPTRFQAGSANVSTDAELEAAAKAGTDVRLDAQKRLATLDIAPWQAGWAYYKGDGVLKLQWHRIGGVLITALLLTFGAPFWYERLKDVARLREAVSGGPAAPRTITSTTGAAAAASPHPGGPARPATP